MKLKKVLAGALALTVTASMIGGCGTASGTSTEKAVEEKTEAKAEADTKAGEDMPSGTESASQGEVELQVAVFEGGYGRAYWDAVAEEFEAANPGVTVVIQANPQIGDVIRPNILAGNPPDFIYLPSSNNSGVTTAMIKDKALADISDVMETVKDKIIPGFLDSQALKPYGDDKIYLAPMYYSTMGLWYNKGYFTQNDLDIPVTWEEFFALGDKAKELGRSLFTYQGLVPTYLESMIIPAIASASGSETMNACFNYDEAAWKNENVKSVLGNIAKIGLDGYLMDGTVSLDHTQAQSQWLLGKALFHPNGSWVEGEMADAPKEDGFEYGFTAPPVLAADGDKYVYTAVEEMYIPAKAKNIEMAKKFLAFQYTDKAIELNAQNAKGIPPVIGAAKLIEGISSPAVYESYAIFEKGYKPYIGNFATVADTELIPKDELYNPIGDVMSGKLSVDDWVGRMVEVSQEVRDKVVK